MTQNSWQNLFASFIAWSFIKIYWNKFISIRLFTNRTKYIIFSTHTKHNRGQYCDDETNIVCSIPQYLVELQNNGHHANLITRNSTEMIEADVRMKKQTHHLELKRLKDDQEKQTFDEEKTKENI